LPRDCLLLCTLRLLLLLGLTGTLHPPGLLSLLDTLLLRLLLLDLLDPLLMWLLTGLCVLLLWSALLLLSALCLLLLRPLLLDLLDPLLMWLLSGLSVPLLRLVLLLLSARLLSLWTLLLRGCRRALPLPTLLLFRLALFFALLVVLRVHRDNRPEKHKQGCSTASSNKLHRNRLL
jgi:hypothetical protein